MSQFDSLNNGGSKFDSGMKNPQILIQRFNYQLMSLKYIAHLPIYIKRLIK